MTGTLEASIEVPYRGRVMGPREQAGTGHGAPEPAHAERDIAHGLVAGHASALEHAFRRWADLVHGIARSMVGVDDADDVTQQVFVQAWRSRTTFDPTRGEVPGWLVGITRNTARDHLRRRAPGSLELDDALDADPRRADDDVVTALLVASTLRDLPDEQRVVLELTLLHEHTQAETADRLGLPLGTVKSRHRRGLRRLRDTIGGPTDA